MYFQGNRQASIHNGSCKACRPERGKYTELGSSRRYGRLVLWRMVQNLHKQYASMDFKKLAMALYDRHAFQMFNTNMICIYL